MVSSTHASLSVGAHPKALYACARAGELRGLTGPTTPTGADTIGTCA